MQSEQNNDRRACAMKKIGIGYERFKDFVENDMYYVDKTMLVRDIVRDGG